MMPELSIDGRSLAMIISSLLALCGVIYGIKVTNKAAQLKIRLELTTLELSKEKHVSDEAHKRILISHDIAGRSAEAVYKELQELRNAAAIFFASIEAAEISGEISEERRYEAILSARKLSLFYPPETKFQGEINNQIEMVLELLYQRNIQNARRALTALKMNIWKLISFKMSELNNHNSIDNENLKRLTPHEMKDVP